MPTSFNILVDSPTLVSPNGGETFSSGNIDIQWSEPDGISSSELVWYEIFITDDFDLTKQPELLQIATIPSGNSSYSYYIHKNLKGNKCRIGVRAVNHQGLRGKISFSASNFTIASKLLPSPALMEPVSGNTYFSYLPIIFDHNAILGRCSQRAFYQIYYKSDEQDIDWTLIRGNIMVGSEPFDLDVSSFPTSQDYSIKVELAEQDNISQPVFIDNIIINNINYFFIDTIPPSGSIKIVDNQEYVNSRDIVLSLDAYDAATGVKEYQIEQTNLNDDVAPTPTPSRFAELTPLATWDIQGDRDGSKLIQARFKDYGDNIIQIDPSAYYFRTYKNIEDREVTAMLYYNGDLYIAFSGEENPSDGYPLLYKNLTLLFTLDFNVTALEYYNGVLYIAIADSENKGILQRMYAGTVESIADNDNQYSDTAETVVNSLYSSDSIINTMEVFDDILFMGLQNGELLSFNGSTVSSEYSAYENIRNITYMRTDGNLLYIFFDNSTEILVMYKDENGNYIFTTVDTGN